MRIVTMLGWMGPEKLRSNTKTLAIGWTIMATNRGNIFIIVLIICAACVLFFGVGLLALQRGCSAWESRESLSSHAQGDAIIFIIFGTVFVLSGVWSVLYALANTSKKTPNIGFACLWSVFLLLLGGPFLYFGIAYPERIEGSVSLSVSDGSPVFSHKTGTRINGAVFILVGSTCLGSIPFVWHHYRKKRLLTKGTSENQ